MTRSEQESIEKDRVADSVATEVGTESFEEWRENREFRRNIRTGNPWLNSPPPTKEPERHSPSQLKQCHRKIYYRQLNAPQESKDPSGIFWAGTKFEESLMMPYLESVVDDDTYVRNSMWVDYTLETEHGDLRIRGETDPVIVDEESRPLLVTEIKTKQSVDQLEEPNDHHLAQVYAYLEGLSREWETEIREALIIYGSRTSLEIRAFSIRFDSEQWLNLVQDWATKHTEYRLEESLPPADPEYGWECTFCSYKHRCGMSDQTDYQDIRSYGLLPHYRDYPREKVVEYLESHEGARLTPTLAYQFPGLTDRFGVYEWKCQRCSIAYEWRNLDWDISASEPPLCPSCLNEGIPVPVVEPIPSEQYQKDTEKKDE